MVAFALFRMFPVKGFFSWPLSTFKYDWVLLVMIRKSPYLHKSCTFSGAQLLCSGVQPAPASLSQKCSHDCISDLLN